MRNGLYHFVVVRTILFYCDLSLEISVCIQAAELKDYVLLLATILFAFLPIAHMATFICMHRGQLRMLGLDIFWTLAQEFTLTGPVLVLFGLLRDGELPNEFL